MFVCSYSLHPFLHFCFPHRYRLSFCFCIRRQKTCYNRRRDSSFNTVVEITNEQRNAIVKITIMHKSRLYIHRRAQMHTRKLLYDLTIFLTYVDQIVSNPSIDFDSIPSCVFELYLGTISLEFRHYSGHLNQPPTCCCCCCYSFL